MVAKVHVASIIERRESGANPSGKFGEYSTEAWLSVPCLRTEAHDHVGKEAVTVSRLA
jgi:hypothetical protein